MKEAINYNNKRVTINVNYITAVIEHSDNITEVTLVDGKHHSFKGSYDEVLKELFE